MRKNLIFYLILVFFNLLFFNLCAGSNTVEIENPLKYETFEKLLRAIIHFLRNFTLVVFPIIVIIAGYKFMSAGGDPRKIEEAKKLIWYALIGLIIILAAEAILEAIKSVMGVQ
jgi:hypothetical protein